MRQSEAAYLRLREDILSWAVQPGEPLSESATAERLGISRTPVREAMRQLAQENLVHVVPGKGAFVASISLTDVIELFQLRHALEPFAAQLAAARPDHSVIDDLIARFESAPDLIHNGRGHEYSDLCHQMDAAIGRMTHNHRLQTAMRSIWQEARRIRGIARANHDRLLQTSQEHHQILTAIAERDGETASGLVREHLTRSLDNVVQSFRDPAYGSPVSH